MTIGPIVEDVGGVPTRPSLACVSCRMHFRTDKSVLGYAFSSSPTGTEGTITIVSALDYIFSVPRQLLKLETGKWYWDFETTDSNALPTTWIQGTITVRKDKSYV
jgi:hypothetical protein